MKTEESKNLLCRDPSSFSERLLTVDVDRIDADEPETHTERRVCFGRLLIDILYFHSLQLLHDNQDEQSSILT